jgi:hypothetical protein
MLEVKTNKSEYGSSRQVEYVIGTGKKNTETKNITYKLDYFKSRVNLSRLELLTGACMISQGVNCLNHEILLVRLNFNDQLDNRKLVSTILDCRELIDSDELFFDQEYIKNIPTNFEKYLDDGVISIDNGFDNRIGSNLYQHLPQYFDKEVNNLNIEFQIQPMVLETMINSWLITKNEIIDNMIKSSDRRYDLKDIGQFIDFMKVYSRIRGFDYKEVL